MNSKDKPKRGEGRSFVRETKPRSEGTKGAAGKSGSAKTGSGKPAGKFAGSLKGDAAKGGASTKEGFAPRKDRSERSGGRPAAQGFSKSVAAEAVEAENKPERISKILARAGVASRRDVERMIMEGRVSLNGKLLDTPVVNVTLADKIEVDGMPIRGIERTRLWLYHKPAGLVTTNADPEGRPTVFDNLPEGLPRVMSIGRLDINTEGLLLLTNDGGLSRVLELPTTGWLRRYRVRAHGEIDQEALDKLKEGIAVDGVLYGSIDATLDRTQGHNVWITMGLREGKNREIKNVLGALGLEVNRLIRISYGPFQLGDLPEGQVLEVRGRTLREQLGPRLVEESKANFEAPVYNDAPAAEDKPGRAEKPERSERPERGERFEGKRDGGRQDRREHALGRLDTKRNDRGGFGGGARGKGDDRDSSDEKAKKRPPMGTSRTANVWMAPGARPTTDSKAKKSSARAEAERLFDKPKPSERRVVVNRADDDADWIRAENPPSGERDGKRRFGGDKSFGDRGPREDRGFSDRPRGERSFGDRPSRGDRPFGDKPRGDRKPREDGDRPARSFSHGEGRPQSARGERSFDDRRQREGGQRSERGERSFDDRPRSGRPGGKPFGGKPGGSKSFGGKPGGGRGKPGGGKPSGPGRPGGPRSGGKPRTPRG
jgi:23S rRNA pseudouridine2605 synthase